MKQLNRIVPRIFFSIMLLLFLGAFVQCSSKNNSELSYVKPSYLGEAIEINMWQLLYVYNQQPVKLEGYYRIGFEMSALFPNQVEKDYNKAIWIDFDGFQNSINPKTARKFSNNNFFELKKFANKKIQIVGTFDCNSKGHLDQYLGTISNMQFISVIE